MTPGIPMAGDPNDLFSHTEGRCRTLFITAILLPIFCLPFLGLRIWTIIKIVQKWHIDDSEYALLILTPTNRLRPSYHCCGTFVCLPRHDMVLKWLHRYSAYLSL